MQGEEGVLWAAVRRGSSRCGAQVYVGCRSGLARSPLLLGQVIELVQTSLSLLSLDTHLDGLPLGSAARSPGVADGRGGRLATETTKTAWAAARSFWVCV